MIPYYNHVQQNEDCKDLILNAMKSVFESGQFYSGEYHDLLKQYIKTKYNNANVELTNSCTSALQASLISLNIKRGSRILLPALTYAATAQSIIAMGCIPTFVDINSDTWLLDTFFLDEIYEKYGSDISTLITVDLYGQGVELNSVRQWCDSHNIKWIIDAAHSFGICNNEYDQTIADAVCLSFNPLKNFSGSGGGAIVSKVIRPDIMSAVCTMGKFESDPDKKIIVSGLNFRMLSTQAATLVAKAPYYENNISRKMQICKQYYDSFKNYDDDVLMIPKRKPWGTYNYYSFSICPYKDKVKKALKTANIEYSSHYKKSLNTEPFVQVFGNQDCEFAERLTSRGNIISLPSHWHLTDAEVDNVIKTVINSL